MIRLRQVSTSNVSFSSDVKSAPPPSPGQEQPKQRASSGGSGFFKVVAFAVTGFTLGLGYVTLNPDSRKQIEAIVPQSSQLFEFIDDKLGFYKKLPATPNQDRIQDAKLVNSISLLRNYFKANLSIHFFRFEKTDIVEKAKPMALPKTPSVDTKPAKASDKTVEKKVEPKVETQKEVLIEKPDWKNPLKSFELQEQATLEGRLNYSRHRIFGIRSDFFLNKNVFSFRKQDQTFEHGRQVENIRSSK